MPLVDLNNARIHYDLKGPGDLPVLVFSNSLGTNCDMWNQQLAEFSKQFQIMRYDTRGHGQSSVAPGRYTIEGLALDLVGLLDHLELSRVYFCGLSMGGMTGMWMGKHVPERLHKMVLCNTALKIGTSEGWNSRMEAVRSHGLQPIASAVLDRWFTPAFRSRFPDAVASARQMLVSTAAEGYVACCGAIRDADFRGAGPNGSIAGIRVPTLVVSGAHDPVTTPADARAIADCIAGAQRVELEAAHLSNIEAAPAFTTEVGRFLTA